MSDKDLNEGLLVAYADGELGPEDVALVEAAIAVDSSLQARVEGFKQSGALLRDSLDIDNAVTPDHIIHRIRKIEAAALKKRQASLAEDNNQSPSSWWSIPSLGWLLRTSMSLRPILSLGGSFAAGLACAIFLISPGLLTPENESFQSLPSGDVVQMVMRGSDQNQMPYIRQHNQNIFSGGSLIEKKQFSVMYKSPIEGSVEIFEVTIAKNSTMQALLSFFRLDIEGLLPNKLKVEVEQLTNLGSFMVDDQEELSLRIEVSNNATTISHDLSFKVVEP